MKNKLFFRIFGALASGLLIFSFFAPFSNSYSVTLWDGYSASEMLHIPIMLIALAALSVILFAANTKLELIYMSVGASLFFSVTETFAAINSESFSNLGMGYYFLVIGTIIMGIMAFICVPKKRSQDDSSSVQAPVQSDIASRMETLYGDNQQIIQPTIQTIPVVEPVIQPVEPVSPVNVEPISMNEPIPEITEAIPNGNIPTINNEIQQHPVQPAVTEPQSVQPQMQQPVQTTNVNIQAPIPIQPVGIEQMDSNTVNPVVSEFSQNNNQTPVQPAPVVPQPVVEPVQPVVPEMQPVGISPMGTNTANPAVSEFSQNSGQTEQPVQTPAQPVNNGATMDIFGASGIS